MTLILAACAASPPPAPTTAATAPEAAAGPPGSIGVSCKATRPGHPDYNAMTVATKLDVCSVGGDGALTLVVKGQGADRVNLFLAGYHGAGSYALNDYDDVWGAVRHFFTAEAKSLESSP